MLNTQMHKFFPFHASPPHPATSLSLSHITQIDYKHQQFDTHSDRQTENSKQTNELNWIESAVRAVLHFNGANTERG